MIIRWWTIRAPRFTLVGRTHEPIGPCWVSHSRGAAFCHHSNFDFPRFPPQKLSLFSNEYTSPSFLREARNSATFDSAEQGLVPAHLAAFFSTAPRDAKADGRGNKIICFRGSYKKFFENWRRKLEKFENLALNIVVNRFMAMHHNDGEEHENKREKMKEVEE